MVMVGHFLSIFKYAESFPESLGFLDRVFDSKVGFFLSESFWLYLFFIVSDYLVSKVSIKRIRDIIFKSLIRFLRFAIPILFAYFIIYIIFLTIGFHAGETAALFQNEWYQTYLNDQYSLKDVLLSPIEVLILVKTKLNGPYWVLREMLLSSVAVYFIGFFKHKFPKAEKWLALACLLFVYFGFKLSGIVSACIMGMLICWYEDRLEQLLSSRSFAVSIVILTCMLYFLPRTQISYLFFLALVLFIPKTKIINSVFSSRLFDFLGKISFGVYSFHWPIYCSIGALIMIGIGNSGNIASGVFCAMGVCILITLIVSFVYHVTFEQLSVLFFNKIKSALL